MQLTQGDPSFGQMPAPPFSLGGRWRQRKDCKWLLTLSCVILGKSTPFPSSHFASLQW